MPAITTVIPVFNRAHVVEKAIVSALSQELPTGCSLDVIAVDDGSTDDLAAVLQRFGSKITCIKHAQNKGAAAARNTGIAAAKGDYVAFLDSDDAWLPGKIAAQIEFMERHGYPASCTAYVLVRAGLEDIVSPSYRTGALRLSDLAWGCFVSPGSTLVCRRDVFSTIGAFDVELQRLEDWDWLLRFARAHDLGFLATPLASIEARPYRDTTKALGAIDRLDTSYASGLAPPDSRRLRAALEVQRAALYLRDRDWFSAAQSLANSLRLVPWRNKALGAVLHNRRTRG